MKKIIALFAVVIGISTNGYSQKKVEGIQLIPLYKSQIDTSKRVQVMEYRHAVCACPTMCYVRYVNFYEQTKSFNLYQYNQILDAYNSRFYTNNPAGLGMPILDGSPLR